MQKVKSLNTKFQIPTLLVALVVLLLFGSSMAIYNYNSARKALLHNAEEMRDYIAQISISYFKTYDFLALDNLVEQLKKSDEVDFAVFYNSEKNPVTKESQNIASYLILEKEVKDQSGFLLGYLKLGFNNKNLMAALKSSILIIVVNTIISFFVFVITIKYLADKFVIKPIKSLSKTSEEMSKGDLTLEVDLKSDDEIGVLSNSLKQLGRYLRDIITKITTLFGNIFNVIRELGDLSSNLNNNTVILSKTVENNSTDIEEINNAINKISMSAEGLADSANRASSSVYEMSTAIKNIADSADMLSSNTNETAASIEEMAVSVKEIAQSIEIISSATENTVTSINELNVTIKEVERSAIESSELAEKVRQNVVNGVSTVDKAMEGFVIIEKNVKQLADITMNLGKKSTEIGQIINVIADIADNTNLLALNAAIIAAQSSEHGKGFGIVAEEIKSLSQRTTVATKEIGNLIEGVREEINESVNMTNNTLTSVENGTVLIKNVKNTFYDILQRSEMSAQKSKAIQNATSEQALGINTIAISFENINTQIAYISNAIKELNKSSNFITDAVEKIKDLTFNLTSSTNQQSAGSKQISDVIENVSKQSEEISRAIKLQKDRIKNLLESLINLKTISNDSLKMTAKTDNAIQNLNNGVIELGKELKAFKV